MSTLPSADTGNSTDKETKHVGHCDSIFYGAHPSTGERVDGRVLAEASRPNKGATEGQHSIRKCQC